MEENRLCTLVAVFTCILTPVSICFNNPRYLYANDGFADGGDLYSHYIEAHYIKESLKKGLTNFWFGDATLGYPLFTAYQPLPGVVVAVFMIIFERFLSPQLSFRLLFVTILTLIPAAVYKSAQNFGMKPMQQITLCLLSFAIQSWRNFGLEISAFVFYGLMTQAIGMLVLFPAVSIFYNWIILKGCNREHSTLPVLILALSFLTNFFIGILTCIMAGSMLVVKLFTSKNAMKRSIRSYMPNFCGVIFIAIVLISWWVLPCVWGYSYVGGLPWRGESEDGYPFMFVMERFTEGEIFDSKRYFPWFTILVILGITFNSLSTVPKKSGVYCCSSSERSRSMWLLLSTCLSLMLLLGRTTFSFLYNLIPLHKELETVKYLSAIHFCGMLHASNALSTIIENASLLFHPKLPSNKGKSEKFKSSSHSAQFHLLWRAKSMMSEFRKLVRTIRALFNESCGHLMKSFIIMLVATFLWINHFKVVGKHLTMAEVNPGFLKELKSLRNGTPDGRLLGHKGFGTASSFDLAFIPHYTGKPGLLTYSRGYHDSLSLFYMESLRFNPAKAQLFVNTLRLYNVRLLVTSNIQLDESFINACRLRPIKRIEELIFYEVLPGEHYYGYFDFVRIAGHIQGDLKQMRQAVLTALELYNVNSLLLINPRETAVFSENVLIDVKSLSLWNGLKEFAEKTVQVTWSLNGEEASSEAILEEVIKTDSWKWIYSQVIDERTIDNEYHALVHVSDKGSDASLAEHLLLKVTYHPFWKSYFYRVSHDFLLSMFNKSRLFDGKVYVEVNHVIPNLMSISLPPGRYLVVFKYQFPGIFKILTLFCAAAYIALLLNYISRRRMLKGPSKDGVIKFIVNSDLAEDFEIGTIKGEVDLETLRYYGAHTEAGGMNVRKNNPSNRNEVYYDRYDISSAIFQKRQLNQEIRAVFQQKDNTDDVKRSNDREDVDTCSRSQECKVGNGAEAPTPSYDGDRGRINAKKVGSEKTSTESIASSSSSSSGSSSGCGTISATGSSSGTEPGSSSSGNCSERSLNSVGNFASKGIEVSQGSLTKVDDDHCGAKVAMIRKSESSESSNDEGNGLRLQSRSRQSKNGDALESDENGEIVRELRQTFLRKRRNTLARISSLRK